MISGQIVYSNNFIINEKIFVIDHDTTINYAKLAGVKMVLLSVARYVEFLNESGKNINQTNINIYTDSQFVCRMLTKDGYPVLEYNYILLQSIFELCNKLNKQK